MARTRYYHGGEKVYGHLIKGGGIDGEGIYLTTDYRRAFQYGSRGPGGVERVPHITVAYVDPSKIKLWNSSERIDLREFATGEGRGVVWPGTIAYLDKLRKDYPDGNVDIWDRGNIWLQTLGQDNNKLIELGYQAIKNGGDLIVLDPSVIEYSTSGYTGPAPAPGTPEAEALSGLAGTRWSPPWA